MAFVDFFEDGGDDCWLWRGTKDRHGYGKYQGKLAHRLSYAHFKGPIPTGMCVCHSCDNPPCVNPAHLWLGTMADNMRDMSAKGRVHRNYSQRGENNPHSKLTDRVVIEIMSQRHAPISELASRYGVSHTTVARVRDGKTWTHLTNPAQTTPGESPNEQ